VDDVKTYKCETHRILYEIDESNPLGPVTKHTHELRPVRAQCYLMTHPAPVAGDYPAVRTMANGQRVQEICRIVQVQ
jgi:hypothetical protein